MLRQLDLVVLVLAFPVFLAAGLPLAGYAAAAGAWLAQRGIQTLVDRRAASSDDPRTVAGLITGSMIARGWLVALAVFGVGMTNDDAGLTAAVLVLALFTLHFSLTMMLRPFGGPGAR